MNCFVCFKKNAIAFTLMNLTMKLKTLFHFACLFVKLKLKNHSNEDLKYNACLKDVFVIWDVCYIAYPWNFRHVWMLTQATTCLISKTLDNHLLVILTKFCLFKKFLILFSGKIQRWQNLVYTMFSIILSKKISQIIFC